MRHVVILLMTGTAAIATGPPSHSLKGEFRPNSMVIVEVAAIYDRTLPPGPGSEIRKVNFGTKVFAEEYRPKPSDKEYAHVIFEDGSRGITEIENIAGMVLIPYEEYPLGISEDHTAIYTEKLERGELVAVIKALPPSETNTERYWFKIVSDKGKRGWVSCNIVELLSYFEMRIWSDE